jgi:hypothetical protein
MLDVRMVRGLALAVVVALSGVAVPVALAEDVIVEPKGEYAKIDVKALNETVKTLRDGTAEEKEQAAKSVQESPEKYAPPAFYALSRVLFDAGKKDDAAFWFYAGQLRARFDANRCADVSAREAVSVLNMEYGPTINKYAVQDVAKLENLIPRVVEWDKKTDHKYDHRWINLHGMQAMIQGLGADGGKEPPKMSLPKEDWEKIAETTRTAYLDGFKKAIAELKESRK